MDIHSKPCYLCDTTVSLEDQLLCDCGNGPYCRDCWPEHVIDCAIAEEMEGGNETRER